MTEVEETVGRPKHELSESEQRDLLQSWMNAQQAIVQFNHQSKIIQDDAKKVKSVLVPSVLNEERLPIHQTKWSSH